MTRAPPRADHSSSHHRATELRAAGRPVAPPAHRRGRAADGSRRRSHPAKRASGTSRRVWVASASLRRLRRATPAPAPEAVSATCRRAGTQARPSEREPNARRATSRTGGTECSRHLLDQRAASGREARSGSRQSGRPSQPLGERRTALANEQKAPQNPEDARPPLEAAKFGR